MVLEPDYVRTTQEVMWQGMLYTVDAQALYREGGVVQLPDGTMVMVDRWDASNVPPKIVTLKRVTIHPANLR